MANWTIQCADRALTISSVFFPAYTFTWCSSTSTFAGVKPYLRYTSSGSCFQPPSPKSAASSSSVMECSTTTTGRPSRSSSRFDRYLAVLYDHLHEKLYGYHVLQADETPVLVNKDGRPAGSRSYFIKPAPRMGPASGNL